MSVIDEYLQNVNEPQKSELQRIRQLIKETLPDIEEVISYAMPGFKYKGKYLVTFAAFKDHMSIFPGAEAIEVLGPKLAGYKISKGTVQFTIEKPLPDSVIKEMVLIRKADIDS